MEPLYSVTRSVNDRVYHLLGAKLQLAALPGVTQEWLARTLKCHSARAVLGKLTAAPDDPYWLPGGWIEIDSGSDSNAFLVSLRGENVQQARQILSRARAFVRAPAP